MVNPTEIRWVQAGVVAGFFASVLYPVLLFAPLPLGLTAAVATFFGPSIGVGSLGLYWLIRLHARSVTAALGAIHNVVAGGLFTAMVLVQLAVRHNTPSVAKDLAGVWLGLDVAWDMYIGLGTLFLAYSMLGHPRFRWPFAAPGFILGLLVIVLNLIPFPVPPADAGLIDVGPFVGLWYLAATIQAWRSLRWASEQLKPAA